jgi:hypothetical protein
MACAGDIYGWVRIAFKVLIPLTILFRTARLWASIHHAFRRPSLDRLLTNRFLEQLQAEILRELAERSADPAERLSFASGAKKRKFIDPEKSLYSCKDVESIDTIEPPSVPTKVVRRSRSLSPSNLRRCPTSRSLGSLSEISPVTSRKHSEMAPPSYTSSIELPRRTRINSGPILPSLLTASSYYYAVFTGKPKHYFLRLSSPKPLRRWRSVPIFSFFPTVLHHFITNTIYYSREYAYGAMVVNFLATPGPSEQLVARHGSPLSIVEAMKLVNYLQALAPTQRIAVPKKLRRSICAPVFWTIFNIFSIYATFVINTELTLQWNNIQGVQSLNSVGQFLPCCFGVGGLVKVLWSASDKFLHHRKGQIGRTRSHEQQEAQLRCSSIELETARLWRRLRDDLYDP